MQRDNIVLTTHAKQRMKLRRITEDMIITAIKKPDQHYVEPDGDTKFIKTVQKRTLHVVSAYLTDERKWLVKSVWVRGEDDPQPLWKRILSFIFGRRREKRREWL
jgi:hypothetical protein